MDNHDVDVRRSARSLASADEGGLSAPPGLGPWDRLWWWLKFWLFVKTARLRFIAVLLAIGGIIAYWDTLKAYYEKWTRPGAVAAQAASDLEFWCPMHPAVVRDHPDKCPICGMPLSKRKKGDKSDDDALPPGVISRVQLSPYRVALAGIQTWAVDYRPLTKTIQTVGFVEFDERKLARITARVTGKSRIDKLYVNVTGGVVHAGDPVADLYSPDLVVTVQNLLDARSTSSPALERIARERLRLWGIGDDQVAQILKTGRPITHLTIRSPISGHVLKKYQVEGEYVEEGARLFDVADLSTVWIEAQVYEDELAFLKEGLAISATTKAYPNRTFTGTVSFLHPHLDATTRTLRVRFEAANLDHDLRPGMYANVALKVPVTSLGAFKAAQETRWRDRVTADMLTAAVYTPTGTLTPTGFRSLLEAAVDKAIGASGLVLAVPESSVIDTLGELYDAIARSNASVGGRVIQKSNAEYLVRSVGWVENVKDLEESVVKEVGGTPILVRTLATVQVGTGFRRNVFEKGGDEVVGGVVVMRHGENPLAVTERVKRKIQDLQPGLPPGVRIVPAYDRTHLIHGAIDTLAEVMWHEMLIASIAILLILMHVRSVFVICVTLPLSVLFSFLLMWLLRRLGLVDVQANIMSLAGITISIGILVDQAIVMVENATHHLKEHFGDKPVTGDTTAIVIKACRTVGRPIFFSVLIILISFIPVFAMSGREGKLFHPMAFTKSLAMVGVALISVTLVPALIPTFIRGRLRGEEDNWIVRSFINIYKPMLTWSLPRRNLVMWMFATLLILAAGMFPMQAILGLGAGQRAWEIAFFFVVVVVITFTTTTLRGAMPQALGFASLVALAMIAYHFPKIGVEFMPPLNEGTAMDMPITVPRASITQVADDLKARDALLRGFPEVESVIGKAGRADTPTDPAPLDMVETFVNYRPRELWPKRALRFEDASRQVRIILAALESRGLIQVAPDADERDGLVNDAAMNAVTRFDETLRELALQRYGEFERELGPALTRFVVDETIRRFGEAGDLRWQAGSNAEVEAAGIADELSPGFGKWLAKSPTLEDVTRITARVADELAERQALTVEPSSALAVKEAPVWEGVNWLAEGFGAERKTFAGEVLRATAARRLTLWRERVNKQINWELFDRGVEAFTWAALDELAKGARKRGLVDAAARGSVTTLFLDQTARAERVEGFDSEALKPFVALRAELEGPFAKSLFLWRRTGGPKGDLLQEIDTVVQVPGWSNIWTQPIANRIDMLSTGVRTQIGVRVFGPNLESIDRVCKQIEQALKPIEGARDVVAEPIMGEGYLEIKIDRDKAARYGLAVADIQDTIEVALGGRVITQTVEGRDRFPVRVRYARDFREDEEMIKRLVVSRASGGGMAARAGGMGSQPAGMGTPGAGMGAGADAGSGMAAVDRQHVTSPDHAARGSSPLQVPLGDVAVVQIVEGPTMIKSENGRLRNYVTLNVRGDRDIVGFVDEAQRVVTEKVHLPEGVHIEWAGEFEHQVRAAQTLRIIFPAVLLLIFVILYLTYKDLQDAGLMLMAVPEALAGGIFFQFLYPKILHGWSAPPVDFSVAIWVGYIAAFGMATETGIIMLVYLREAIDKRGGLENIKSLEELREAVIEGAVHRLRPKLLTEGVAIVAIAPMLFSTGVGSEIISAMALPVLGGLLIADEVVDIFLPVRFYWVRRDRWLKLQQDRMRTAERSKVHEANGTPMILAAEAVGS